MLNAAHIKIWRKVICNSWKDKNWYNSQGLQLTYSIQLLQHKWNNSKNNCEETKLHDSDNYITSMKIHAKGKVCQNQWFVATQPIWQLHYQEMYYPTTLPEKKMREDSGWWKQKRRLYYADFYFSCHS